MLIYEINSWNKNEKLMKQPDTFKVLYIGY